MFSKFYYKRKLKSYKASRRVKRSFLNIKELKHLVVGVECADFSELRYVEKEINPLLKRIPMVSFVIFLNIAKVEEISYAVSTRDVLLFKEDLIRKRTPKAEVIERIDALQGDVFVNLNRQPSGVIDFLSAISLAKMRVGFEEKKEWAELILTVPQESGYKLFFEKLIHFMGQINAKAA
jgi:hypothetical protein